MFVSEATGVNVMYDVLGAQPTTTWIKVWDGLPPTGTIAPVWDGQFLYYAVYWDKDGRQFWIVTEQIGVALDDIDHRKKVGEQVLPLNWMKLEAPTN